MSRMLRNIFLVGIFGAATLRALVRSLRPHI